MPRFIPVLLAAALLTACGDGTLPLEEVDPDAAPAEPSWSAHVEPILQFHCVACHDPDGPIGAEDGKAFDTCDATRRNWRDLEEAVFEEGSMPPGGAMRLQSYELLILQRWHDQGAPCD